MEPCQVFVSCTTRDLYKYREVALDVVSKANVDYGKFFPLVPVSMNSETQDGERNPPLEDSLRWVRQCDWIVLIVAWNYGTVPEGQPYSVTECEYIEAMGQGKKCFVFIAGEPTDQENQYWPRERSLEGVNLLTFHPQADSAIEEKLVRFKARLRENKRFSLFTNIEDFRVKLAATITNRVIKELFQKLGPQIVALGLQRPLRDCFREVKLLARLKRLHDRLHSIRQFGIRRWRESLLTRWPDGALPPVEAIIEYLEGLPEIKLQLGKIDGLAIDLPSYLRQALPQMNQLIEHKFPEVPACGKQAFEESTEIFASRVQKAFTGCNSQMERSALRLDQVYSSVVSNAEKALQRRQFPPDRGPLLHAELERGALRYRRLKQVLQNHYGWQRVHDELELIDASVEVGFGEENGDRVGMCTRALRLAASDLIESRGASVRALLAEACAIVTEEGESDRLNAWPDLTLKVRKHLDAFVADSNLPSYQAMRTHFDDLFFQVDRETLCAVVTSEGEMRAIEAGLLSNDDAIFAKSEM